MIPPPQVNPLVHEPVRLALLLALLERDYCFTALVHRLRRVSKGNVSNHLGRLEDACYVVRYEQDAQTWFCITEAGKLALAAWSAELRRFRESL